MFSTQSTTEQTAEAFMTMSARMELTASFHEGTGNVFLAATLPSGRRDFPHHLMSIMLDVDQTKALINTLTEAVTR